MASLQQIINGISLASQAIQATTPIVEQYHPERTLSMDVITRKPEWQELLHNFLLERAKQPFAWGKNDCALFAADFRGKYADDSGANAIIKSVAGSSTVEDAAVYVATKNHLQERKSVLLAQRGDLVIYQSSQGLATGIVHLNGRHALFVSPSGLHKIPLKQCKRAWRVG